MLMKIISLQQIVPLSIPVPVTNTSTFSPLVTLFENVQDNSFTYSTHDSLYKQRLNLILPVQFVDLTAFLLSPEPHNRHNFCHEPPAEKSKIADRINSIQFPLEISYSRHPDSIPNSLPISLVVCTPPSRHNSTHTSNSSLSNHHHGRNWNPDPCCAYIGAS